MFACAQYMDNVLEGRQTQDQGIRFPGIKLQMTVGSMWMPGTQTGSSVRGQRALHH